YPIYQKGNPQLRVYLPNFWLKLVTPPIKQLKNVVQFHCSMEMTMHDIHNYLEKIYNVYPVQVVTKIKAGYTRHCPQLKCIVKDDDIKIAYVTLNKDETFTYPDLFPKSNEKNEEKSIEEYKKENEEYTGANKMPGLPSWFRI
ncbi:putative 39S ribosomal protein L23, mitochondrial, partial [Dufourea novaeangliae]